MGQLFNFIVYSDEDAISGNADVMYDKARVASTTEGTTSALAQQFRRSDDELDLVAMGELHTLMTPERQNAGLARVGRIEHPRMNSRQVTFRFVPYPGLSPIPTATLDSSSHALDLGSSWHYRTRWTVREGDLLGAVSNLPPTQQPKPGVFTLPNKPPNPRAVAVMMPFDGFDPVYAALKDVVDEVGGVCDRADNRWEHSAIIDDIVELIAGSSVIICDVTGRNPNVFYEMGLAHMLGREVIIVTQAAADVPFDVAHHRHVRYLCNSEGLTELKDGLRCRLRSLLGT